MSWLPEGLTTTERYVLLGISILFAATAWGLALFNTFYFG